MAEKQTNKERLKDITDSIETGIKELFESDRYRQYLATMSRFHKYSVNNTMLIYMQRPDATLVAGSDYVATHAEDGTVTLRYDGGVIVLIHHDGHDTAEYTVHSHQCG